VAVKQIREYPKRPREIVPEITRAMEAVVMKCLQKDPARRYASVDKLEIALLKAAKVRRATPWEATLERHLERAESEIRKFLQWAAARQRPSWSSRNGATFAASGRSESDVGSHGHGLGVSGISPFRRRQAGYREREGAGGCEREFTRVRPGAQRQLFEFPPARFSAPSGADRLARRGPVRRFPSWTRKSTNAQCRNAENVTQSAPVAPPPVSNRLAQAATPAKPSMPQVESKSRKQVSNSSAPHGARKHRAAGYCNPSRAKSATVDASTSSSQPAAAPKSLAEQLVEEANAAGQPLTTGGDPAEARMFIEAVLSRTSPRQAMRWMN